MIKFSTSSKLLIGYLAAIFVLLLFSCNPYKKIMKNPPDNRRDSARLATVCSQVFPPVTSVVSDTVIVSVPNDSADYFKRIADSLFIVKQRFIIEIETKYKDTCKSVIPIAKDVCNTCYANGYANGKKECKNILTTVTIRIKEVDTKQAFIERNKTIEVQKKLDRTKMWKNIFLAISILLLLLLIILFLIFKRKAV